MVDFGDWQREQIDFVVTVIVNVVKTLNGLTRGATLVGAFTAKPPIHTTLLRSNMHDRLHVCNANGWGGPDA